MNWPWKKNRKPAPPDKNQLLRANLDLFLAARRPPIPLREAEFRPEIVIPCHNQGRYLPDAVASVPTGIPLTLVEDASTDDTAEWIARIAAKRPCRVLSNPVNLLQWGSLNRAVETSPNNLFIVLNADDALLPHAVDILLDLFGRHSDIRLAGGSHIPFRQPASLRFRGQLPERLSYAPEPRLFTPGEVAGFTRLNDLNLTMSSCAFLRSAWEAAGRFLPLAERVCTHDDRDFQLRVASLFPVAVVEEPLALYRVGSSTGGGER